MARVCTVDASVFVAACRPREPGFAASRAFLAAVRAQGVPLIEPAVLPVEVASALVRAGSRAELAREFALSLVALPTLTLVTIDTRFAEQAVDAAAATRMRAADVLYTTVALHFGSRLVTLDAEQLARAPKAVEATSPQGDASK
jgi:predicted nucleic acid-binding protein